MPVDRNTLVAAALGVFHHAGAKTVIITFMAAGVSVYKAVHVEPCNIPLNTMKILSEIPFLFYCLLLSFFTLYLILLSMVQRV